MLFICVCTHYERRICCRSFIYVQAIHRTAESQLKEAEEVEE